MLLGVSATVGKVAELRLPKFMLIPILKTYIYMYKINTEEIKRTDLNDYESINDFFTRHLKEGVRTIDELDNPKSICSP
jgi:phosphatidylserine decarboxylase